MKLLLALLLSLSLYAWEEGQPGDYSYQDYSYQDYRYDVAPPDTGDNNYDTGTYEELPGSSFIKDNDTDFNNYNYNTGEFK